MYKTGFDSQRMFFFYHFLKYFNGTRDPSPFMENAISNCHFLIFPLWWWWYMLMIMIILTAHLPSWGQEDPNACEGHQGRGDAYQAGRRFLQKQGFAFVLGTLFEIKSVGIMITKKIDENTWRGWGHLEGSLTRAKMATWTWDNWKNRQSLLLL